MGEHNASYRVEARTGGRTVVSKTRTMQRGRVQSTFTKVLSLNELGVITLVTIEEGYMQTQLPEDETHPMIGRPLPSGAVPRSSNGTHINVDRQRIQ